MNESQSIRRVAVLDICGTLAAEDSWLALTRDMGGSAERHLEVFHEYREGRITYEESKTQLINLWRATGHANREDMHKIFGTWDLDPAAKPLVEYLKQHGFHPVIITGAVDLYAQTVAERLGIADWYANTPLVFNEAGELVTYHYTLDQSAMKVEQLKDFCQKHNYDPTQALAIGDGPNDLGLFRATGKGIWLRTPDCPTELEAAAWRTIDQLADAIPLLQSLQEQATTSIPVQEAPDRGL